MIRLALAFTLLFAMAANAQVSTRDAARLATIADQLAATETGPVPPLLTLAIIAAHEPTHLLRDTATSQITLQLAGPHIGARPTLKRNAHLEALMALLAERMEPQRIAEVFAATAYYGRNCRGYAQAARGLAGAPPEQAPDEVWLGLASLIRSPAWYLSDRTALRERVLEILSVFAASGMLNQADLDHLAALPIARFEGKGCFF